MSEENNDTTNTDANQQTAQAAAQPGFFRRAASGAGRGARAVGRGAARFASHYGEGLAVGGGMTTAMVAGVIVVVKSGILDAGE